MADTSEQVDYSKMQDGERLMAAATLAYGRYWRQHLPEKLGFKASYLQRVMDLERPMSPALNEVFVRWLTTEGEQLVMHAAAVTIALTKIAIQHQGSRKK